jgi:hypothetical protein
VDGSIAGYSIETENLKYVTIFGAGHYGNLLN